MKIKSIPFFLILILGAVKAVLLSKQFDAFNFFGWLAFSLMWGWIAWGFWKDRDMPAYSGSFRYQSGENKFQRAVYVVVILLTYILGVFFA